jgi:hypothetical protein
LRRFGFRILHRRIVPVRGTGTGRVAARYLVSSHGAGLTNMLFMRPGLSRAGAAPSGRWREPLLLHDGLRAGLPYSYQTCASPDPDEPPHTAHLRVDTGTLDENLERLLASA